MSTDVRGGDERLTLGGATLVLAPGVSEAADRVCADHVRGGDAALVVSLRRSPDDWLAAREDVPATWFVSTDQHPDSIRGIADPGDLTSVGIAVSEFLDGLPSSADPVVCVDSVTTLRQFCSPERTYRFLQVLCGRVLAADGAVHCHADPVAHDDQVLERLRGLFDDVVRVDE